MNAGSLGRAALRIRHDATVAQNPRSSHGRAHSGDESPSVDRIDRPCWRGALRIQEQGRQLNLSLSMYEPQSALSVVLFRASVLDADRLDLHVVDDPTRTPDRLRRSFCLLCDPASRSAGLPRESGAEQRLLRVLRRIVRRHRTSQRQLGPASAPARARRTGHFGAEGLKRPNHRGMGPPFGISKPRGRTWMERAQRGTWHTFSRHLDPVRDGPVVTPVLPRALWRLDPHPPSC